MKSGLIDLHYFLYIGLWIPFGDVFLCFSDCCIRGLLYLQVLVTDVGHNVCIYVLFLIKVTNQIAWSADHLPATFLRCSLFTITLPVNILFLLTEWEVWSGYIYNRNRNDKIRKPFSLLTACGWHRWTCDISCPQCAMFGKFIEVHMISKWIMNCWV